MWDSSLAWLIAAVVLAGADLMFGTVYLLILGAAALITCGAAFIGFGLYAQILCFAVCGIVGCTLLSLFKRKLGGSHSKEQTAQSLQNMNDGNTVEVYEWDHKGSADVFYRGAHWQAQPAEGEEKSPGLWKIVGMNGNTLIIKKVKES